MSAWSSQRAKLSSRHRGLDTASRVDRLLVPFLAVMLFVRVLTDNLSPADSRHTGSLDLSGAIAGLLMLVAVGMLLRRRHGVRPTALAVLWLCLWTAVAVNTNGASTETLREGVREMSVVALFVIVYNARGMVSVPAATRLVQLMGFVPALVALYQLATFTGLHRPHGTFAHSNSAAMFFALAAIASLWRYLDDGRHRSDALLTVLFATTLIATASIDGLATLVAMLTTLGTIRPGPLHTKYGPWVIAGVVVIVFFATPLGSKHIAKESTTNFATAQHGEPNTSLVWRLHKWKTLLPEWERSPVFGEGLGTTTTETVIPGNRFAGLPPHNEYLRYLVETGLVGLAILLAALTLLIRNLVRSRRNPGRREVGTLNAPALALAVAAGCLVNSLADNTLLNSPTCYAAALIIAAVLCSSGIETRQAPIP